MSIDSCTPHPDHARAMSDPSVRRVAQILADRPAQILLETAIMLLIFDGPNAVRFAEAKTAIVRNSRLDPAEKRDTLALLDGCLRIATYPDPARPNTHEIKLRRGALLELLVQNLLRKRCPTVYSEHSLEWRPYKSPCIDVLGVNQGKPDFEAIECKTHPPDLDPAFLTAFGEIPGEAKKQNYSALVYVATLRTRKFVDLQLDGWTVPAAIRRVTQETILSLRKGPPREPLVAAVGKP
jgi:hypothetical protein